jgi:hypothetical protein
MRGLLAGPFLVGVHTKPAVEQTHDDQMVAEPTALAGPLISTS